jgi:hypothetical protein
MYRICGQRHDSDGFREVLDRGTKKNVLGAEVPEQCDFINTSGVGYAAGSRAAEAMLREDAGSSGKNFLSAIHGADISDAWLGMQVVTYLQHTFTLSHTAVNDLSDLQKAFDSCLTEVRKAAGRGIMTADGASAESKLQTLEAELVAERERAVAKGSVDRTWFQTTVKWLVEWLPETELTLIAALGRIARAKPNITPLR